MRRIRIFFKTLFEALFFIDGQGLNPFLVILLITLDLFMFINIERGIHDALIKAPSPYIHDPKACEELFIKPLNYERIEHFHLYDSRRAAPLCQKAQKLIDTVKQNQTYAYFAKNYFQKSSELANLKRTIDRQMQRYNNTLFEKMAKEESGRLAQEKKRYYQALQRITTLEHELASWPRPQDIEIVRQKLLPFIQKHKEEFLTNQKRYRFAYPFIYMYAMLKFLAPLLLLALLTLYKTRNAASTKAKALRLLSAHLLLVTALPAIFYTLTLIYDIIPLKFLELILDKLYRWGLVYLGYYFLIFAALAIAGFWIYRVIKRAPIIERAKRIKAMRTKKRNALQNSRCLRCDTKVDYRKDSYCVACGNELQTPCPSCNAKTPKIAQHCRHCGAAL